MTDCDGVDLTARFLRAAGREVWTDPTGWRIASPCKSPIPPYGDGGSFPVPDWTSDAHLGDVLRVVREAGVEGWRIDGGVSLEGVRAYVVDFPEPNDMREGQRHEATASQALMRAFIRAKGDDDAD